LLLKQDNYQQQIKEIKGYNHNLSRGDRLMVRYISSQILLLLIVPLFLGIPARANSSFTDNKDGTVTDQKSGLMWATTDNLGDISWRQADQWIRYTFPMTLPVQYENWRLPILEELKPLYIRDKTYKGYEADCGQQLKIVPEIQLSCGFVWTGDTQGITAKVFNFKRGTFTSARMVHRRGYRALAVRNISE
jgi:hypothetical protein